MYWEAVLPIRLMLVWPRRMKWLALVIAAVLVEAILLSASRAALIGAAAGIVTLIVIGWRTRSGWQLPAFGLLVLISLTVLHFVISPWMTSRLQSANDVAWYRAAYQPAQTTLHVTAGDVITTSVTIENRSVQTWSARGPQAVALSYHWLSADRSGLVSYEGLRTALPRDLRPGETISVEARVRPPAAPDAYTLQWDLVQEGVTWFSAKTNESAFVPVEVVARTSVDASSSVPTTAPLEFMPQPERSELWSAAIRIGLAWPLTGAGPDNFRHIYGAYLGYDRFDDRITANSLYFETWANMGTLGLISLIGLLATTGLVTWRTLRVRGFSVPQLIGISVALLMFWLHGGLDYFLEFTPTYGLFWLLMGLIASAQHD